MYPYIVAAISVHLIRKSCAIEFFSSENLNDALTAIITVTSIIIGFIGAILPVILSMKNDSKVVQYVFQRDKRKLFLEYIKSTLAIGFLLIVCSIIPYFSDLSSLIKEESEVKKDLDLRLQKQQSACRNENHQP